MAGGGGLRGVRVGVNNFFNKYLQNEWNVDYSFDFDFWTIKSPIRQPHQDFELLIPDWFLK